MESFTSKWNRPMRVLYFRHAFSKWNKYYGDNKKKKNDIVIEEKYVDPEITKTQGVEGSVELGKSLTPYLSNIKVVIVSPMVRALQTADIAFSQHKDLKDIKFIVHPLIMSRINHPTDLSFKWRDYCNNRSVIKFDTSIMDSVSNQRGWQFQYMIDFLPKDHKKIKFFEDVRDTLNKGTTDFEAFTLYSNMMKSDKTIECEDEQIVQIRLNNLIKYVREYADDNNLTDDNILLVGHNGIVKRLFKTKVNNAMLLDAYISEYIEPSTSSNTKDA